MWTQIDSFSSKRSTALNIRVRWEFDGYIISMALSQCEWYTFLGRKKAPTKPWWIFIVPSLIVLQNHSINFAQVCVGCDFFWMDQYHLVTSSNLVLSLRGGRLLRLLPRAFLRLLSLPSKHFSLWSLSSSCPYHAYSIPHTSWGVLGKMCVYPICLRCQMSLNANMVINSFWAGWITACQLFAGSALQY